MKIKELTYLIKPPCPKCLYTLGQAQFVVSPCPKCKQNEYNMYRTLIEGTHSPNGSVKAEGSGMGELSK